MLQIKVKNNHQTKTISRCGFDFKPQELSDSLEVTEHQLFQIKVVRYLEVEKLDDNLEEEVEGKKGSVVDRLTELNMDQLTELAKNLEMTGYSQLNKSPLVEQIRSENDSKEIELAMANLER